MNLNELLTPEQLYKLGFIKQAYATMPEHGFNVEHIDAFIKEAVFNNAGMSNMKPSAPPTPLAKLPVPPALPEKDTNIGVGSTMPIKGPQRTGF